MMTNKLEDLFASLESEVSGNQKKIDIPSVLSIYFGLSKEGYMRLSFMSTVPAPKLESTKLLRVVQGAESNQVFWTCFDLVKPDTKRVFLAFGDSLIDAVVGIDNEHDALYALKKRYITWKSMFKNEPSGKLSNEVLQGLHGELYFLKNFMLKQYGPADAIQAWSGPEGTSKDYAVGTEWYEIKTVGGNTPTVKISSLSQLSSQYVGHLVIIRAERMSDSFENGESSIEELFRSIVSEINDELIEELFFRKLTKVGFDPGDKNISAKFNVKSMNFYKVDDHFPRITEQDVLHEEICNVTYALLISSLQKFKEE